MHLLQAIYFRFRQLLTRPKEQKQAFQWTPEEDAFQTLKGALSAAPVLANPQQGKRFIVDTEASKIEIGGVLSQLQYGLEPVIAYYSKTL
jgi:phospholipid N-methyltransferase